MHYEIYLPFPPTVNNYYVKTQRGVFISQKGRKYRDQVLEAVLEQVGGEPIAEKMLVEIILFPPDARTRDMDNYNKAMLDSLTKAEFWVDDSLIDQLFNYRGEKRKGGQAYIRVTDAGPVMKDVKMLPMD